MAIFTNSVQDAFLCFFYCLSTFIKNLISIKRVARAIICHFFMHNAHNMANLCCAVSRQPVPPDACRTVFSAATWTIWRKGGVASAYLLGGAIGCQCGPQGAMHDAPTEAPFSTHKPSGPYPSGPLGLPALVLFLIALPAARNPALSSCGGATRSLRADRRTTWFSLRPP
jgi:hypothetical protein